MHIKWILISCFLLTACRLSAQGVRISEEPGQPHPSAILDLRSDSKGLLIPSLTTAERGGINEPYDGLLIYNISEGYINIYDGVEQEWNVLEPLANVPEPPLPLPTILPGQSTILSAVSFKPESSSYPGDPTFVCNPTTAYFSSGFGRMFAPVVLPVGSTIYSVVFYYYDNSGGSNLLISLVEQSLESEANPANVVSHNTSITPVSPNVQRVQIQLHHPVYINKSLAISVQASDGWNLQLGVQAVEVSYLLPTY